MRVDLVRCERAKMSRLPGAVRRGYHPRPLSNEDTMISSLERTCKTLLDSLLGDKKMHTLCLNISEPGFAAEKVAAEYLASKGVTKISQFSQPTPAHFEEILSDIHGMTAIVTFDDLDNHPKCLAMLAAHVKQPHPDGNLIVVSREWNSDNTDLEKDLRRNCLFYQQSNKPVKPSR
jgi:hypothetical protein